MDGYYTIKDFLEELEAELGPTKRWSFWGERIDAVRLRVKRTEEALLDQARELEIAVNMLESACLLSEFRARAYPKLYKQTPLKPSIHGEHK